MKWTTRQQETRVLAYNRGLPYLEQELRRGSNPYELMGLNGSFSHQNRPYYIQSSFLSHPRAIQDDYLVDYSHRDRHNSLIFVSASDAAQPDNDASYPGQRHLPYLRQPQAVRSHSAPPKEEDEELQQVRLHEFDPVQEGKPQADQKCKYVTRSKHAKTRQRGANGKFLKTSHLNQGDASTIDVKQEFEEENEVRVPCYLQETEDNKKNDKTMEEELDRISVDSEVMNGFRDVPLAVTMSTAPPVKIEESMQVEEQPQNDEPRFDRNDSMFPGK